MTLSADKCHSGLHTLKYYLSQNKKDDIVRQVSQRYFLLKILAYSEIFLKRKRYKSLWLLRYYIRAI